MTRYLALPVRRCGCGREMVAFGPKRCEFCRDAYWVAREVYMNRVMDQRDEGAAMAKVHAQRGQTVGTVARRFGVSRETVAARLRMVGAL